MDTKEIFDQIKSLTSKYLLIKGICEMTLNEDGKYVLNYFDDSVIYESTGNYNEELLAETFSEEEGFNVECEGHYKFIAMLHYSSAQVGDYPPPNIEVPAHYELQHIEFELEISKEDYEQMPNINYYGIQKFRYL